MTGQMSRPDDWPGGRGVTIETLRDTKFDHTVGGQYRGCRGEELDDRFRLHVLYGRLQNVNGGAFHDRSTKK